MTVKITPEDPNIFPAVEDVDARDNGRAAAIFLGTRVEGQLHDRDRQSELRAGQRPCGIAKTFRKDLDRNVLQKE